MSDRIKHPLCPIPGMRTSENLRCRGRGKIFLPHPGKGAPTLEPGGQMLINVKVRKLLKNERVPNLGSENGFSRRKKYVDNKKNHITHKNAYTGHTELHSGISANKC